MRSGGIPISRTANSYCPEDHRTRRWMCEWTRRSTAAFLGTEIQEKSATWGVRRPGGLQERGEGQAEGLRPRDDGVVLPAPAERDEGERQAGRQLPVRPAARARHSLHVEAVDHVRLEALLVQRHAGPPVRGLQLLQLGDRGAPPAPHHRQRLHRTPAGRGLSHGSVDATLAPGTATNGLDGASSRRPNRRYRVGLILEEALGHQTHAKNLQLAVPRDPEIEAAWGLIPFEVDGFAARLPLYGSNWTVRAGLRARRHLAAMEREGPLDALFIHTQVPAVLALDWVRRVPTVVSLDATPLQYDALGASYGHSAGPRWLERLKWRMNRAVFQGARHLVAWSEWARRGLAEGYGIDAGRVTVIPPGTHVSAWTRPTPRRSAWWADAGPVRRRRRASEREGRCCWRPFTRCAGLCRWSWTW